jgi:hypothetical protein
MVVPHGDFLGVAGILAREATCGRPTAAHFRAAAGRYTNGGGR